MLIYDKYKSLKIKYLSSDTISLVALYLDPKKVSYIILFLNLYLIIKTTPHLYLFLYLAQCTCIKGIARDINGVYTILNLNNVHRDTRDLVISIGFRLRCTRVDIFKLHNGILSSISNSINY